MNIGEALAGQIEIAGSGAEFIESLTEPLRIFQPFKVLDLAPEGPPAAAVEVRLSPFGNPAGLVFERNTGLSEESFGFWVAQTLAPRDEHQGRALVATTPWERGLYYDPAFSAYP